MLGVVISIYYYFDWIRECYFSAPTSAELEDASGDETLGDRILLGALVAATVVIGFLPVALPIIR